ncbi:unnamed protein product [Lampetra planeri]
MELSCLYVLCLVALASQGVLSEDVTDELVTRNKAAGDGKYKKWLESTAAEPRVCGISSRMSNRAFETSQCQDLPTRS